MTFLLKGMFYTGILKPTVLCDCMNYAASYLSSIPHHPIVSGIGGHGLLPPGYATGGPVNLQELIKSSMYRA